MISYKDLFTWSKSLDAPAQPDVSSSWWTKHKNKVYGVLLLVSGLLGGNLDRLTGTELLATPAKVALLTEQVDKFQSSVDDLNARYDNLRLYYDLRLAELKKLIEEKEVVEQPDASHPDTVDMIPISE